ncbi:ABC transporter permease [Ignisphaera sp. 4213-co]|mgnify:CR=1 FL=1|uniref:ABC transporter permease n=1 Tax=Ignisphaera cupida TaxID=3050454 RepID=A0ABD4Z3L4_9CREN|nr:ABC transporter permease [Ignisphaera sp. 4213-co]MDK6027901.1 ABC transporter permease [Ignisphaera sp. 4213-co]
MGLLRYVAIRAALIIPSVLILYTLVFIVLRILPGNPVIAALGTKNIPEEQLNAIMSELGLNKPLYVQYFEYLINFAKGDMGKSMIVRGRPIASDIADKLPATLELTIWSILISLAIGLGLGYLGAQSRSKYINAFVRLLGSAVFIIFIPALGLSLQLVFSKYLRLLPSSGRISDIVNFKPITGIYTLDALIQLNINAFIDALQHLLLPAFTLGLVLSGPYMRLTLNNLEAILESKMVEAYRARGISEAKILKHAFKHVLIPVVTYTGLQFALLMGGAVLTETTFNWPGIGTYLVDKVMYRDYTAIQAVVVLFAIIVGVISLIVDIIYAVIDPRVRY